MALVAFDLQDARPSWCCRSSVSVLPAVPPSAVWQVGHLSVGRIPAPVALTAAWGARQMLAEAGTRCFGLQGGGWEGTRCGSEVGHGAGVGLPQWHRAAEALSSAKIPAGRAHLGGFP